VGERQFLTSRYRTGKGEAEQIQMDDLPEREVTFWIPLIWFVGEKKKMNQAFTCSSLSYKKV